MEAYRKLHLAAPEKAFYTPGDQVPVFHAPGCAFGIQLCYDSHFPEISSIMAARGAEILFMPHASPRGRASQKNRSWLRHLPARAFDNGVFVVACNQWGENAQGLVFSGNALVLGPTGKVIQKNDSGGCEHMLVVDLKADDLIAVRQHPMRYFFPNRRPDLYAACQKGPETFQGPD
jgi:N-carbamoylputrescine amidase